MTQALVPSGVENQTFARRFFSSIKGNRGMRNRQGPLGRGLGMLRLLWDTFSGLIESTRRGRFPIEETIEQTWYTIKVCTMPALAVAIPFGVVLALQVGVLAEQVGAASFAGAGNTLSVIREASPLITALMLSGVAGSAICADLGARRNREELDALEVMGISVIERLVVPRMIAIVTISILLTGVVTFFCNITSLLASSLLIDLAPGTYLAQVSALASPADLMLSLFKAGVFGVICVIVASHYGINATDGPAGVGDAVTSAVVVNFVLLFAANFIITEFALNFMSGPLGV